MPRKRQVRFKRPGRPAPYTARAKKFMSCQYEFDKPATSRFKKVVQYRKSAKVHWKKEKKSLRSLSRLAGKVKLPKNCFKSTYAAHEPINLGRRVILRRRLHVAEQWVALHDLYKGAETLANEELDLATSDMDPASELSVIVRNGIRAQYEEELKKISQLSNLLPCDPDMNIRTQQLFEDFFSMHYLPNQAERDLLRRAGKVSENVLKTWFAKKCARVRGQDIMDKTLYGFTRLDAAKDVMRKGALEAIREDLLPHDTMITSISGRRLGLVSGKPIHGRKETK